MTDFSILTSAPETDAALAWRIQFGPLVIGLAVEGEIGRTLRVGPADIALSDGLPEVANFTFRAAAETWADFASQTPSVGAQSLAALVETGRLKVIADPEGILTYVRFGQTLEMLFSRLRGVKPVTVRPWGKVEVEPIIGRYIRMDIGGRPHRVYYEEAGEGIPLLCLHTAGSDGRQYRALMNDPEITREFRVIAFDLPWHGKSAPPPGFHTEVHLLTTDSYVDTIMAVKAALGLDRPVVMGCSIGGRAVLHLALRHGEQFRAAIGLQSATHSDLATPGILGTETANTLFRPDMDSGDLSAAGVRTVMSPTSPVEEEWETLFYYMQSAPGVFQGDLYYYVVDGDMRNGLAERIDTSRCPLYLLTGEYDLSATPEMTRQLAEMVKATDFQIMRGLGHFPMSEDTHRFRGYLMPVLEAIRALPPAEHAA